MDTAKNDNYGELLDNIRLIIMKARKNIAQKINTELLMTYWEIGKRIVDEELNRQYDQQSARQLILKLSIQLTKDLGTGFSRTNMFNMRKLYLEYPDVQTLSGQLNWSHYSELLSIEDRQKRAFYKMETEKSCWSIREMKRQIDSSLFERLLLSKGKTNKEIVMNLATNGNELQRPDDIIKDPYVFEFLGIPANKPLMEKDLEKRLIRHIEDFLLELGKGFMFVGSQQRITINNIHYYMC